MLQRKCDIQMKIHAASLKKIAFENVRKIAVILSRRQRVEKNVSGVCSIAWYYIDQGRFNEIQLTREI